MVPKELAAIAPIIEKLGYGKSLTAEEARTALNVVGSYDTITTLDKSDGLYFLALTLGVMAKGPTADELHGFVLSLSDQSVKFSTNVDPAKMIDVSGTGGDRIKTFNIGTTTSFVLSAGGLSVAKQATRGYTGFTGSADIFKELGVDPFGVSAKDIEKALHDVGIAAFYTPAFTPTFKNRVDFLTKLKEIRLVYPTPWHLVSWVYSPFQMEARLYGVFDGTYSVPIAQLFQKLGYKRVMVVHGIDGLDEISTVGETMIAELRDGHVTTRQVSPEDLGLSRSSRQDLQTLTDEEFELLRGVGTDQATKDELREKGRKANIALFFKVLYGIETGAKRDIVIANAGAGFYLCQVAQTLEEGVSLARKVIESGKARDKVKALVKLSGGSERLAYWEKQIGA
jgi:anthranilate phosphoribosyltransferase